MKRIALILPVLLAISLLAFAQSEPPQREPERVRAAMMKCPMMKMTSNMRKGQMMSNMRKGQMTGDMKEKMQGMKQRMASMFGLSAEEIAAVLGREQTGLGLSDSQVKQVAELVASSQQQKSGEKMQQMMERMQAGEMECPCCMQPSAK